MKRKVSMFKQNGKNYFHLDDTEIYYRNLESVYNYLESEYDINYMNFAYVTLCSSTLEASLNYIIFHYYINEFGPVDYKNFADSLINISFKNKLHSTPNIVTKSKYYFNSDCFTIKTLEKLISLRNKILHKKPLLQTTELDLHKDLELGKEIELKNNNHIELITKNDCQNFHKAIMNFRNEFMNPFLENELLITELIKEK
ncbi:hypothetical protein KO494_13085 [Lacinutrix sp. C3R15]|uniref:hypothetical protein n=1 Tax=Flavobacteriaceae TaxID=49546 RepID=UPI001C08CE95|nr:MULTISPECIES: hypothetical protein [Flavobacteriaceae]MBU2940475.1 hypothetical protein [Lacinutrix sp. C3R15]MDO6623795.1 hypothetical protein [Oceanihabitans sp. 1_MG-2023]